MLEVGRKYVVRDTAMNRKHGLIPGKDCYIAYLSSADVSLRVFQNGGEQKWVVPLALFGSNFEQDPYGIGPNAGYAAPGPFLTPPAKRFG